LTGGDGSVIEAGNAFLEHLQVRGFSPATVRAYAFDLANFAMFLDDRGLALAEVAPTDLFGYLDWQSRRSRAGGKVVPIGPTTAAPATLNRRISAVRGLFEHLVTTGARGGQPCPGRPKGERSERPASRPARPCGHPVEARRPPGAPAAAASREPAC
jgi:site-specific recombinase XerD